MGKKASTKRGKNSGAGHQKSKHASKRTKTNDQRTARLRTIRFNSRRIQKVIRRKLREKYASK